MLEPDPGLIGRDFANTSAFASGATPVRSLADGSPGPWLSRRRQLETGVSAFSVGQWIVTVPPSGVASHSRASRSKVGAMEVRSAGCPGEVMVVAECFAGVEGVAVIADQLAAGSGASLLGSVVERCTTCEQPQNPSSIWRWASVAMWPRS